MHKVINHNGKHNGIGGGGQFVPLIRNISAVVFGATLIEYKPVETIRMYTTFTIYFILLLFIYY